MSIDMSRFSIKDKEGNDVTSNFSEAFIKAVCNFWFTIDTGKITGFHPIVNGYKFNMVLDHAKPLESEKVMFHEDVENCLSLRNGSNLLRKWVTKLLPISD